MDPTTPLALRTGALILRATEFDAATRAGFDCGDDDFIISLPQSRNTSKVIDANTANLLERFREPTSFDDVVAAFSAEHGVPIDEVREAAEPLVARFLRKGFLRREDDEEVRLGASFRYLDERSGFVFHRPLQLADESEVYLVRRADTWMTLKIAVHGRNIEAPLEHEEAVLRGLPPGLGPAVLDSGTLDDRRYLALEWCPGVSANKAAVEWRLRDERGPLLALLRRIVDAYAALHEHGVLHADVHPRNLLVLGDGRVRVIDFGLAQSIDGNGDRPARAGVAYFYEPEFARALLAGERSPAATALGEQFSIAAVLYRLASGRNYCDFGVDRARLLTQVAEYTPMPFKERGVEPWADLEAVLARALSKEPADRFGSVSALGEALAAIRAPAEAEPSPTTWDITTRDTSVADRFVADTAIGGPLLEERLAPPSASLYSGAAGVAYALLRIAVQRADAEILAAADVWIRRAVRDIRNEDGIYVADKNLTPKRLGRSSPYHTASGIFAVQALIHRARGDSPSQHVATKKFVREASRAPHGNDLAFGRSGVLMACALLVEAGSGSWDGNDPGLLDLGERTMQALWKEVDELPGPQERTIMTGVAHGWGGYLYATLAWCRVTGAPLPAGVKMRLDALATLAEPYGRGARWPWDLPTKEGEKPQTMPGWCGGSVGQVLLWSLAFDSYGDEGFAAIAEAAAWDCWDALREASTLCCDLAGRGYGLLNMYRRSGDEVWLRRAWRIAESAAAKNSFYKACPHSLFYGRTGLAVLQEDLEKPATAVFPFFEIEPGA